MPAKPEKKTPEVYTVSDLEQLKVIADPLRLRLLELFCKNEMTTKQVAGELGEKPTRLYHHVDALERVGLIRLTRTKQNRGTVEKYYQSVAKTFRAEPALFSSDNADAEAAGDAIEEMTSGLLQRTGDEFRELVRFAQHSDVELEDESIVTFCEFNSSADDIKGFRERLLAFLAAESENPEGDSPVSERRRFRFSVMLFPLDYAEQQKKGRSTKTRSKKAPKP